MVGIKDFEIPSCCEECEYTPKYCSYCLRLHQAISRDIYNTSRHPDCPLVEDVAPVIHAKWERMSGFSVEEDNRWKCSRCGNVIHAKSKMDLITFYGWDSRCGAKMNKE